MTALLKTNRQPFAFDPGLNIDEALATVAERLDEQHVTDTTARELHATGVNVLALAQRIEQSDEFDVAALAILVNHGFVIEELNEVLEGETPTCDVDTAIYHIAND